MDKIDKSTAKHKKWKKWMEKITPPTHFMDTGTLIYSGDIFEPVPNWGRTVWWKGMTRPVGLIMGLLLPEGNCEQRATNRLRSDWLTLRSPPEPLWLDWVRSAHTTHRFIPINFSKNLYQFDPPHEDLSPTAHAGQVWGRWDCSWHLLCQ